jgi:uncharacterized damage-inducible protein DinB
VITQQEVVNRLLKEKNHMKKLLLSALAIALVAGPTLARPSSQSSQSSASQQGAQSAQPTDKTPPSYDMKPQSLLDLDSMNKKYVSLAEALPAEKFNWRPSDDSRSFAEVLLHVSGERYQILVLGGAQPPAGFDGKTYEKSTTDKAKIIEELNKSENFAQAHIQSMTNGDFANPLPKLGPQANAGDVVYILIADAHEHLGQAIAYARVNGVVPPWTIAAKKAAADTAAGKKAQNEK